MVMATDALVPVTDHRPAALEMQRQPAAIKAETLEVAPGCGGHLTILYGSTLATQIGVSPTVIGLLVVAIGTSMPELVTSIIAAMRNEADLCVGNVIGSNIFNSLVVLPTSALVRPLPIPEGVPGDIVLSLVFAAILIPVFVFGQARMNRYMGALFLALYVGYMVYRTAF